MLVMLGTCLPDLSFFFVIVDHCVVLMYVIKLPLHEKTSVGRQAFITSENMRK